MENTGFEGKPWKTWKHLCSWITVVHLFVQHPYAAMNLFQYADSLREWSFKTSKKKSILEWELTWQFSWEQDFMIQIYKTEKVISLEVLSLLSSKIKNKIKKKSFP